MSQAEQKEERYVTITAADGRRVRTRNMEVVRRDVLALLAQAEGGQPCRALAEALQMAGARLNDVLAELKKEGLADSYRAVQPKQRKLTVYWCAADRKPTQKSSYNGAETLQAFQIAALARLQARCATMR